MNVVLPAILGFAAASIAVPLVKRLFGGRRITQTGPDRLLDAGLSGAELRTWSSKYKLVMGVGALVFTLVLWPCFVMADRAWTRAPVAAFRFVVPGFAWLLPAMLLALVTSGLVTEKSLSRLLGPRYGEFVRYRDAVSGYSSLAAARIMLPAAVLLVAAGSVLLANCYACFSDDKIVIHDFWPLRERRYDYSNIVLITSAPEYVAPNGSVVIRRVFVFRFSDGSSWSTLDDPSGASPETKERLAGWVSCRSGRGVTELPRLLRKDL